MFEIETPQKYQSWGKVSKWVWRKAMKGVKFSLGSVRRKTHTVKNGRDDEMTCCGFKKEKAHGTWPYFWPVARVVADQNPLGFGTGPLLKVCVDFGVEKQKQRTKSQKARQERERLRERQREMRLALLGEINHSSQGRADVKEKKTRICLCVKFGLLLFFLNPDDDDDFSSFCHIKKYRNLRKIKPMI